MTLMFAVFGLIVFMPSLATVGFKSAFKRLCAFTLFGLSLDALFVLLALTIQGCFK